MGVVVSFASLGKHPKGASLKTGHAAMKETLLLSHAATAWSARRITRKVGSSSARRRMALPKLASTKLIRVDLKETCRQRPAAMDCSVRRTSSVVVVSFASLGKHPKRASLKTGHAAMKATLLLSHAATAWPARRITRKVGSSSARRRMALPKLASTKL